MYEFIFKVNNEILFRCDLKNSQCSANKKDGSRCSKRCVIGYEYCYSHLLYNKHLRIKASTIPNAGKGLYAISPYPNDDVIFRKGSTITEYKGELINAQQLEQRYDGHNAPYGVQVDRNNFIDGAKFRTVGSLANNKPNHNNAKLVINQRNKTARLEATKNIRNGDEIFLAYGQTYRKYERGVEFKTQYKRK